MTRARGVAAWWLALAASAAGSACGGGTAPPPEPGTMRGLAPDLRGMRVLVLPVQNRLSVPGDPDAELAFSLQARGTGVEWVLPAEVEEILARTPAMDASTHGLPVSSFLAAEVQRVGDPLYGQLRRMAALVDARVVLLPVQAALEPVPGDDPRVRFWTALIDARTGRVAWFSVLEGGSYPPGDPRVLASAVDEVTRMLLWYVRG